MTETEGLKIIIQAEGAPAASAQVKSVEASVKQVGTASTSTAAAVEQMSKRMEQFSRITSIVSAGASIIMTLRKVAEAVDAVILAFNRPSDDIRIGNLTARVNDLAAAYGRVTGAITGAANAQERAASSATAAADALTQRQLATIDRDAAAEILRNPANRDQILADAAARKRAVSATAAQAGEEAALGQNASALQTAQERAAAAAAAGDSATRAQEAAQQNRFKLKARMRQETGFGSDDLFSLRFSSDSRFQAAAAKFKPMLDEVDKSAATALQAMAKARDDEAAAQAQIEALRQERALIERRGVTRRLQEETAELNARAAGAGEPEPTPATPAAPDNAARIAAINANAAAKIAAITVAGPSASSAYGAIGGIMGNQAGNADRLRDQRAAALEAINREQTTLLAQIKEALDE